MGHNVFLEWTNHKKVDHLEFLVTCPGYMVSPAPIVPVRTSTLLTYYPATFVHYASTFISPTVSHLICRRLAYHKSKTRYLGLPRRHPKRRSVVHRSSNNTFLWPLTYLVMLLPFSALHICLDRKKHRSILVSLY